MALGKDGVDWKAIKKDQKAIDKLPNRGRASSHEKALGNVIKVDYSKTNKGKKELKSWASKLKKFNES